MVKKNSPVPTENENIDVVQPFESKFWETDISDQTFLDLYNPNQLL